MKNKRSWYRIENKASAEKAEVFLYDEIGMWGITADQFVKDFRKIDAKEIDLRVNSYGGEVFDGNAIANAIKEHPATVTAHVDALAASIASVIVASADRVVMAKNAYLMIHKAWVLMAGNADDMRKEADLLDKLDVTIAQTYADRTDDDASVWLDRMGDEMWLNAEEAVEFGLADEITEPSKESARADLSKFKNPPADLADRVEKPNKIENIRDVENALVDAGMSRKAAKLVASEGFKSDHRDDADADTDDHRDDAAVLAVAKMEGFSFNQ